MLLGVVLALGVRTVVAAPRQVTDEMRAVARCAGHMQKPVSVPASRRCCHVSSDAGDAAVRAAAPAPLPVAPIATVILPRPAALAARTAAPRAVRRRERDGPPLYLGLRTIRC